MLERVNKMPVKSNNAGGRRRMRERVNKMPVKSNNVNDGGFPIPVEIEEMVISNLPTKSLFRFQCVSKSWRHMISDFCESFFEKLKKSNPSNGFICTEGTRGTSPYSLLKLKNGCLEHEEWKLELGPKLISCSVKCSHNGLVLLTAEYVHGLYYILWNPSIRKWRKISFPDMGTASYDEGVNGGICFDKISGGVKIVLLSRKKLLVYSCKSSIWSSKDYIIDPLYSNMSVSADGAVYWHTMVELRNGHEMYLLKFDSKDDQLHSILMPECFVRMWSTVYRLSTLRDTLYVWSIRRAERLMGLWVLNEDHSWMNLMNFTYELPATPGRIWFVNDGNDILVNLSGYSSRFYTCNLANKVFTSNRSYFHRVIEIEGGRSIVYYFNGFTPYVDCPFFPKIEEVQ